MKLGNIRRLMREDMPDAPDGEYLDIMLQVQNQANEQVTQGFQGGLTFGENTVSGYGPNMYRFTHGTELVIQNPLKVRPRGIEAIRVVAVPGGSAALPVMGNPLWRFIDGADPKAPQQIGVTVNFAPPYVGDQRARAWPTVGQVIPTSADTPITFGSSFSNATAITWSAGDPTKLSIASPGLYEMRGQVSYPAVAGAWGYAAKVKVNGTAIADSEVGNASAQFTAPGCTRTMHLTTGDYVQLVTYQSSGANRTINSGDSAELTELFIQRVSDTRVTGYAADVELFFHGG